MQHCRKNGIFEGKKYFQRNCGGKLKIKVCRRERIANKQRLQIFPLNLMNIEFHLTTMTKLFVETLCYTQDVTRVEI